MAERHLYMFMCIRVLQSCRWMIHRTLAMLTLGTRYDLVRSLGLTQVLLQLAHECAQPCHIGGHRLVIVLVLLVFAICILVGLQFGN